MNLIGKIIGNRYELLEEVGNGGMAKVYKAKDHVLNRYVAVKILKDEFTTDPDFVKRFNTEAQSAASLSDANIVSIYDVGHEEDSNLYYIVMELVKGKTLKEIINKEGSLSWKWAVNIAMQIASALAEAHKNGIVHRDIKPHNIIITEDGVAKVADFGIAKAVSNSTITAFGTTIGSVHYFSPEQAKGGLTDAKSDLYSLGVVMYEMLTGKVPFDADTAVSVALKHMQEEPVEPKEINDEIPQAVNDIVMKAMKKEPMERYQTAEDMIADLSKALKDPDGDFVVIENADGGYTKVMKAIKDDGSKSKTSKNKNGFFDKHPKAKVLTILIGFIVLFLTVFLITKVILDGGIKSKVQIPNLVGQTYEDAQNTTNSEGLTLQVSDSIASSEVEEGKIISQDPEYADNKKIKKGSTISVVLSAGPEVFELPDFTGKTIESVREEAKKMGIVLNEQSENSTKVEEGKVISQDIKAGTEVKSGDTVTVHVSSGVAKTTVPTVVGMNEGTAKATLSNAKLKANITYENHSDKTDGEVLSQSIEQGQEVAENTTVNLVVNKIETKESKVTLNLNLTVAKNVLVSKNSNTLEEEKKRSVTIKVVVNGKQQISNNYTVDLTKASQTITLGEITGNGTVTITASGENMTIDNKNSINLDEYNGNRITMDGTLNK